MTYNHNDKAGNQGDVIKHLALIAAIDTLLGMKAYKSKPFRYCDTFAGYSSSQLICGKEWKEGIGRLYSRINATKNMALCTELSGNPHVELYRDLYLTGRPNFVGKSYPGSSLIVHDLCVRHGVVPRFSLWDTSPAAIESLMTTYKGSNHSIFTHPAKHDDGNIRNADFVLIDPPMAPIKRRGGLCWGEMIQFMSPQRGNFLFWLPIDFRKSKGKMIENTREQREDAVSKGLSALQVRWKKNENSIKTVGCQLFYRFEGSAHLALEAAVKHICDMLDWRVEVPRLDKDQSRSFTND